jgi:CRISPR-associated protein Csd1
MILQALNDYYARAQLAPPGWELKAIPFFIVLDHSGQVVSVMSRADQENKRGSAVLVPQSEIRSGKNAWAQPNLLWDHYGFVLGEPKRKPNGEIDPSDSVEKATKQLGAFIARVEAMALRYPESIGLAAVAKFYRQGEYKEVFSRPDAVEMVKIAGANMTFRLVDAVEPVIHESWLQNHVSQGIGTDEDEDACSAVQTGVCLVTGKREEIARLHPKVYGVCSKPSPLAAANSKEAPAYSSYGKEQGFIFPIGKPAAFSYATALNHLLRRDSTQRIQIGDASTVFWSERESEFESVIPDIFGDPPKDDPDRGTRAAQALFTAIQAGKFGGVDDNNRFHVLGLAPNAARISIRFYHCLPLAELGERIGQHFNDLEMVRGQYDPQYPSLKRLLQAVCLATSSQPFGDIDRLPPNLGGAIVDAVFAGPDVPYPSLWLNVAVGRCRAEQNVNYYRAAAIKACLNRQIRRSSVTPNHQPPEKEFLPMLDLTNTNPGYRMGRLFAVLEKIQEEASPGLNATIRDRYYGAASSTPASVYPTLLNLTRHHIKKLDDKGKRMLYRAFHDHTPDDYIGKVLHGVPSMPAHLMLRDQGGFALGYYHQRQDFFAKKPDDSTPITEGTPS